MQTQEGRVVKKSFSTSNLIKKTYNYNFFLNCSLIKKYITTRKRKFAFFNHDIGIIFHKFLINHFYYTLFLYKYKEEKLEFYSVNKTTEDFQQRKSSAAA